MEQKNNSNDKAIRENGSEKKQKPHYKYLTINGTRYKTLIPEKYRNRNNGKHLQRGQVYSEFPGTVLKVDVSEGDYIKKGNRLYIYEAMKMKNRAYSPVEGTVKKVHVRKNDIIRKGNLLFVIE